MKRKVAINGFGRIGRLVFRKLVEHPGLDLVAINDIASLDNLAYLLKYDSVQAAPQAEIATTENSLHWNGKEIRFLNERNPADLPWKEMGVEIVVESSGVFTKRDAAAQHLQAGAQQVIISAPGKGVDLTICMGVNEEQYDPSQHQVISNASCTTNCLAPVAKVLNDSFGIKSGLLQALLETHFQRLNVELRALGSERNSLTHTLTQAAALFFRFARQNRTFYLLQLGLWFAPRESEAHQAVAALNQEQHRILEDIFTRAAEEHGNMRGRHTAYAATFAGMLNTYIGLWLNGFVELDEALVYRVVHQFEHGIYS